MWSKLQTCYMTKIKAEFFLIQHTDNKSMALNTFTNKKVVSGWLSIQYTLVLHIFLWARARTKNNKTPKNKKDKFSWERSRTATLPEISIPVLQLQEI